MALEANPSDILGIEIKKEVSRKIRQTQNYKCTLCSPLVQLAKSRVRQTTVFGSHWPPACFYRVCKLKMTFIFFNGWKRSKEKYVF